MWALADVLGQDDAVRRLLREKRSDRLAHAYMFEGAPGRGKTTLARGFAASLLCLSPTPDGDACQTCRSCHMLGTGNHPDYLELPREPQELRIARFVERASTPGGENVEHQPLLPFLRLKPVEGGFRVAVIPDAERIRHQAANAFLKTLEEPPGRTRIILTVNARDRLPATITSRCRRLPVKPLPDSLVAAELMRRRDMGSAEAGALALTAEGSLGAALALAGEETLALWRWLSEEAFLHPGPAAAQRLADTLTGFGGLSAASAADGANAGKRKSALAALDLAALALRRGLRGGMPPEAVAKALGFLWNAGEQVVQNVRTDLVLQAAAFEVMAVLKAAQ